MTPEQLEQYLGFYQDLGVKNVYRRAPVPLAAAEPPAQAVQVAQAVEPIVQAGQPPVPADQPLAKALQPPAPAVQPMSQSLEPKVRAVEPKVQTVEPMVRAAAEIIKLPSLAPPDDTLAKIREDIGDCQRCGLCKQRTNIVFGSGNENARLVFVGEGPGADEDAQGLPFVGRAGQLLTQMIENTAAKEGIPIRRPDVYICNVVKCRPPENRAPLPEEMEICGQFLFRQLMVLRPKAICALGSTAAKALLATKDGVTRLRGNWHQWHGIPVIVTFHPSYLLRQYNQEAKRDAWEDLKKVLHFVYD